MDTNQPGPFDHLPQKPLTLHDLPTGHPERRHGLGVWPIVGVVLLAALLMVANARHWTVTSIKTAALTLLGHPPARIEYDGAVQWPDGYNTLLYSRGLDTGASIISRDSSAASNASTGTITLGTSADAIGVWSSGTAPTVLAPEGSSWSSYDTAAGRIYIVQQPCAPTPAPTPKGK